MLLQKAEDALRAVDWLQYGSILFISKSVGTVAAAAYVEKHRIPCRHILFTPVEETFAHPVHDAIAFHGTADPWADTARIRNLCELSRIPLYITEDASHSLETGDVHRDLRILETVMRQVEDYIQAER